MTIVLNVPDDLYQRLEDAAASQHVSKEECAMRLLRGSLLEDSEAEANAIPAPPSKPADIVKWWKEHNLIGPAAGLDDVGDTLEYARELRRRAETRER